MSRSGSETVPPGRSLFLCALLVALPVQAALNLEGMTGYWMVPTAKVMPFNSLELSANRHVFSKKAGMNWVVGMGVLPHLEVVARFAMPMKGIGGDLSNNPKLGYTFQKGSWHPTSLAVGVQDVWGGARLVHANYAVATQRWRWLEATVGYGDGSSHVDTTSMGTGVKRLGGVFWGVELDAPLPDSFPVQAALIHDNDGEMEHTGGRVTLRDGAWSAQILMARDWSRHQWDYGGSLAWTLPPAREARQSDSLRLLRLRLGPWIQSFMGTEVGRFDFQAALELTGIVQPAQALLGYARVRQRLWDTDNFRDGKTFAYLRQEPRLWLEGAGVGWSPANRIDKGLWLQGGVADGSWQGGMAEGSLALWPEGFVAGAAVGYWYSPDWHLDRQLWNYWIDWETRDRSWFARADAGRYWNQDEGFRLRVGRHYGRLVPSGGFGRTDATWFVDARLEIELDGFGWHPVRAVSIEPVPVFGHGYMSTVARRNGDGNPLRPGLGKEAPLPLRGRYGTWP